MDKMTKEFLKKLEELCKMYNISIWNEDGFHGAFILRDYDQDLMDHLKEAKDQVQKKW